MNVAPAVAGYFSDGYCAPGLPGPVGCVDTSTGADGACCVLCSSLRFIRRQMKIPAAIAAISASPPMTPPTIAPIGVE